MVVAGAVALLGLLLGVVSDSRLEARRPSVAVPRAAPAQVDETERDSVLEVLVVGADEQPVPGAQVRVFWEQGRRYFDAGQATTDGRGKVSLARIPRGRVWVIAEAEGL